MKVTRLRASLFAIALVVAVSLAAFAYGMTPSTPPQPLSVRLDDDLNAVFGVHAGARAAHAKGVVLLGTFTPSTSAASITMAAFLQHTTPVPVTIRFSNGSGVPTVSDNDPSATPHGFAIIISITCRTGRIWIRSRSPSISSQLAPVKTLRRS
jgi:catalase